MDMDCGCAVESGHQRRYPSDLTDAEWTMVEPLIPPARRGGDKRRVNLRAVVNGLMYVLNTGCPWRAIPSGLPPRSTLHDYFGLWDYDGTLQRIEHVLRVVREEQGRAGDGPPRAVAEDRHSVDPERAGRRSPRQARMLARRSKPNGGGSSMRSAW